MINLGLKRLEIAYRGFVNLFVDHSSPLLIKAYSFHVVEFTWDRHSVMKLPKISPNELMFQIIGRARIVRSLSWDIIATEMVTQ